MTEASLSLSLSHSFTPRRRRVLAICGARRGDGATSLALSLAVILGQLGEHVLLVDGDPGPDGLTGFLGVEVAVDLEAVLCGDATLNQAITPHGETGLHLILGRGERAALAEAPARRAQVLGDDLALLATRYDRMVVDLGTTGANTRQFLLRPGDRVMAVGTEETLDALYGLTCQLREAEMAAQLTVVINQATSHWMGERCLLTLRRACIGHHGWEPPFTQVVHEDQAMMESLARRLPLPLLDPDGPAGRDIVALAETLAGS